HGGRVNQRVNRRRAFHRIGQPDIKRNLRRLTAGAEHQAKRGDGEPSPSAVNPHRRESAEYAFLAAEIQRSEVLDEEEHADQEGEVANAVDDEGLLAGVGGRVFVKVEADQQIRSQPYAFPAHKQQKIVVGQHQHQHEEHEQVEVGEEAVIPTFM